MTMRTGTRGAAILAICGALLVLPGVAVAKSPTAETLPADTSLITDTYALLSGTVNPNGFNVVYRFEWGPTTAYGKSTPVTSAGNGKADVPVDISLDELKPNTTYHYRLVVSPAEANGDYAYLPDIVGADQTFSTTHAIGLAFRSAKAAVSAAGRAAVKVKAIGPADETATGRLRLTAKVKRHRTVLGAVGYSVDVGKNKILLVRLSTAARAALKSAGGKLKVQASAKTRGTASAATKTLTLEA